MRHVSEGLRIGTWTAALCGALAASAAAPAFAASGGQGSRHTNVHGSTADAYVLSMGHEAMSTNLSLDETESLREKLSGDFLWFRRAGKAYVIEDAATLKEAYGYFAALRDLDPEREDLSRREEALTEKERELDRAQGEIDRQVDRLTDGEAGGDTEGDEDSEFMVSDDAAPPTVEERAEIDRELEDLHGQQEALRPRQRELEAKDRELDTAERALDAREEKLERAAEEKLWSLLDAAVKNGTAKNY